MWQKPEKNIKSEQKKIVFNVRLTFGQWWLDRKFYVANKTKKKAETQQNDVYIYSYHFGVRCYWFDVLCRLRWSNDIRRPNRECCRKKRRRRRWMKQKHKENDSYAQHVIRVLYSLHFLCAFHYICSPSFDDMWHRSLCTLSAIRIFFKSSKTWW